jgi:hypothetical protein
MADRLRVFCTVQHKAKPDALNSRGSLFVRLPAKADMASARLENKRRAPELLRPEPDLSAADGLGLLEKIS